MTKTKKQIKRSLCLFMVFSMIMVLLFPSLADSAKAVNMGNCGWDLVEIKSAGQTVDSITVNGITVYSKYRPYDGTNGSDSEYSCAAFVHKFYSQVYGLSVSNLYGSTSVPKCKTGSFVKVDTPQVGDIVRWDDGTHWAIVKEVKSDGSWIIIQQNAWNNERTKAQVNNWFVAGYPNRSFFRYSTGSATFSSLTTTNITNSNAQINAELAEYTDVTDEGFYLSTNPNMSNAVKKSEGVAATKLKGIWYDMNKWYGTLQPLTTYYWQIYVCVGNKETKSAVQSFTTKGDDDIFKDLKTQNVTATEASLSGSLKKYTNVTDEGFYISGNADLSNAVKISENEAVNKLSGMWYDMSKWYGELQPNTKYYWKFYIVTDGVEKQSATQSFTTAAGQAKSYFSNYTTTNITTSNAIINAAFDGNVYVKQAGFYISKNSNMSGASKYVDPSSEGKLSGKSYNLNEKFGSLEDSCTYYWQMFVIRDGKEVKSDVQAFTTGKIPLSGIVSIEGTLKYNQVIAAYVTNCNNTSDLQYQWYRNNVVISGANAETYKLTAADINCTMSCVVTTSKNSGNISQKTSSVVGKTDGPVAPTGYSVQKPSVSGLSDGKITLAQSNTYQYATNTSFSSATKITGTVISGLKAGTYYVRVAENDTTYAGAYATIVVPEGNALLTGTVTISGTLKYDQTLTATVSNTNNTGTLSYQWMREGVAISGATSSAYKTVEADIGKKLSCVVTSSKQLASISGETSAVIDKANGPAAPTGYTVQKTSKAGASDGKIIMAQSGTYQYADNAGFTNAKKITGTEITGLTAGTYYVRFAGTTTTHSGAAATITVEDGGPVLDSSSPVLLGATAGSNKITISWKANELVDKYAVFRKVSGGKWTKIVETKGTANGSTAEAGQTCSYDDATAEAGVTYYYSVRGMNASGKFVTSYDTTGVSATIAKTETLDKSSPVLLGATAGDNSITVSWKANSGVDKYTIFRKVAGGSWTKVAETTGTANGNVPVAGQTCSYVDGTAQAGVTYSYSVRGMNSAGKYVTSYNTTGVSATISVAEPLDKSSPVLVGATAGANGNTLSWIANSGVDKYTIFRKVAGGRWAKYAESTGTANGTKAVAGATCNYVDASVEAGVTYCYTVRGMNAAGSFVTSYDTTGVSAVVQVPVDTSSPVLIGATAGQNAITFSWTANSGVAKYTVFRKTTGGWTKVAEVDGANGGTTLSYTDQAVTAGTTYIYTARGMDANGKYVTSYNTTGVSATVAVQEVLDKNAPALIGANSSSAGIVVTWIANSGVDKYAIFRKTTGGWTKVDEAAGASAGSICNYVDRTAVAGTTYTYTVRGMDANGKYVTSYDTTGLSCTK